MGGSAPIDNQVTPRWHLQCALEFVRLHQPWAMDHGFYLAMAGGVLNRGEGKDLDLVAMPRTYGSDRMLFIDLLTIRLGENPNITIVPAALHVAFPDMGVEIAVV